MGEDSSSSRPRPSRWETVERLAGFAVTVVVLWQAVDIVTGGRARLYVRAWAAEFARALGPDTRHEPSPAEVSAMQAEAVRIVRDAAGGENRG